MGGGSEEEGDTYFFEKYSRTRGKYLQYKDYVHSSRASSIGRTTVTDFHVYTVDRATYAASAAAGYTSRQNRSISQTTNQPFSKHPTDLPTKNTNTRVDLTNQSNQTNTLPQAIGTSPPQSTDQSADQSNMYIIYDIYMKQFKYIYIPGIIYQVYNKDREIFIFPVQLTTSRIDNLTRLILTLAICG